MKYTYTPAIQSQLANIEPMICPPSAHPDLLASLFYGFAMMYQSDLDKKYATNGGDWAQLRDRNLAKAKYYWECNYAN